MLSALKAELALAEAPKAECFYPEAWPETQAGLVRLGEWPLYRTDAVVRHAQALQACAAADEVCVRLHPTTAKRLDLSEMATVSQGDIEITLPLECDERIAPGVVSVACALSETVDLGHAFSSITIKR